MLIRVRQLVLTTHNMDNASLGLHANSTIQWEHWVTVHLHLLLLTCQLRPIQWDLQLALWPHHPHLQICGPNPARTPVQPGCLRQQAHLADQLVQNIQRVDPLLIRAFKSQVLNHQQHQHQHRGTHLMLRKDIKQLLLIPLFDQIHEKQHFFFLLQPSNRRLYFPSSDGSMIQV